MTFNDACQFDCCPGPLPALPENPTQGDHTLILSLEALAAGNYTHSLSLVNEAVEQGISWDAGKAEALNLRGTYKCVRASTCLKGGVLM